MKFLLMMLVPMLLFIPSLAHAKITTHDCISVIVKNAIEKGIGEEASISAAAISGNVSQVDTNQSMAIDINNYTNHIENCVVPHQK